MTDAEDQAWLDERVRSLAQGFEAAVDIAANWTEGRTVGRLHPGLGPGDYIASIGITLPLSQALVALSGSSSRQVARVAGVSHPTVLQARAVGKTLPTAVVGKGGRSYPSRRVPVVLMPTPEESRIGEAQRAKVATELWMTPAWHLRDFAKAALEWAEGAVWSDHPAEHIDEVKGILDRVEKVVRLIRGEMTR